MKRKSIIYSILFLLTTFAVLGNTPEHIRHFHSDIIIDSTGRVEVTETITVYASGKDIKRGIVRSIPLFRMDNDNNKVKMNFRILSVLRDEKAEPYSTDDFKGYRDIYIGSKDVLLKPGVYKYTIRYETYGQVGFFDTYDELYWNVTGNDWAFHIDTATTSIILPLQATLVNTACYTGSYGQSNNDCSFQGQNGIYEFRTHDQLKPKEGFTVAIAFTPNIIKRPPPPPQLEIF